MTAVAEAIGAERVGLRLSPAHQFNGIGEEIGPDLTATYRAVVDGVAPLGLAYLSLLASPLEPLETLVRDLRERFDGVVLLNDGFGDVTTLDSVEKLLETGLADAVVVGRPFLANPDLADRWRAGCRAQRARTTPRSTAAAPRATPTTRPSSRRPDPLAP